MNNECFEVHSIEKMVADTIQNLIDDKAEDDTMALKPVTQKEALYCKRQQLSNLFVTIREDINAQLLNT